MYALCDGSFHSAACPGSSSSCSGRHSLSCEKLFNVHECVPHFLLWWACQWTLGGLYLLTLVNKKRRLSGSLPPIPSSLVSSHRCQLPWLIGPPVSALPCPLSCSVQQPGLGNWDSSELCSIFQNKNKSSHNNLTSEDRVWHGPDPFPDTLFCSTLFPDTLLKTPPSLEPYWGCGAFPWPPLGLHTCLSFAWLQCSPIPSLLLAESL